MNVAATDSSTTWDSSYVSRIDSADTDESAFGSNLVTPTDEQELCLVTGGIEARLGGRIGGLDQGFSDGVADLPLRSAKESNPPLIKVLDDLPVLQRGPREAEVTDYVPTLALPPTQLSGINSSTSMSSLPSASELLVQSRRRLSALYRLPNTHISVEDISPCESEPENEDYDTIRLDDFIPSMDDHEPPSNLRCCSSWPADLWYLIDQNVRHCALTAVRMTLFLPWCLLVGGSIVLSPGHLKSILYSESSLANFVEIPSSPMHHYAYLANYGLEHVTVFLGFVFLLLWLQPNVAWLVLSGFAAQLMITWNSFVEDPTVALGEDERQTVYNLAKTIWWCGEIEEIELIKGGYYRCPTRRSQAVSERGNDSSTTQL